MTIVKFTVTQLRSALISVQKEMKRKIVRYLLVVSGIKKCANEGICSQSTKLHGIIRQHLLAIVSSNNIYSIYQCVNSILEIVHFFIKRVLSFLKN